jgi:type IV pilus assembly protein PilC
MAIDFSTSSKKGNAAPRQSQERPSQWWNKEMSFGSKISIKDKVLFYKDLAILMSSGVDIRSAYEILIPQFKKRKILQKTIVSIKSKTEAGKSIVNAFSESYSFTRFELVNLKIGEETKNLIAVLNNLSAYFESKIALRRQLVSLLTYPFIIVLITIGVLYFMLSSVVPMFASVFQQFGSDLPYSTQKILYVSNHLNVFLYSLVGFVLAVVLINKFINSKLPLKKFKEKLLFKIPVFGALLKTIALNRFCKSMSLLLDSKVQLPAALDMCKEIMDKQIFKESIEQINNELILGKPFAESLRKHRIFDHKLITMVQVGEKSNSLPEIFKKLSDQYDNDVTYKAKLLGTIMEPMIIVIIGAIVGIIMVSMYAPMFDMSKIFQPR